jgi:molybdopterin molybdotransferase
VDKCRSVGFRKDVGVALASIDDARRLLLSAVRPLPLEDVGVAEAAGRVLAEDVVAVDDVPGFDNSAMDGFALRNGAAGRRLAIVGESRAGAPFTGSVGEAEAVRISTGAAMPAGADAVLQVELVEEDGDAIVLGDAVVPGRNVRRAGGDLRAGGTVLSAGTRMGPAEAGVAVAAGRATVKVSQRPRVAVLTTGDELRPPGALLGPGQIHNSNMVCLTALARREGATIVHTGGVPDDRDATRAAIGEALEAADVLILSGGVSVGPHDHVKPALTALGVEELLWRVALRPGRPTWIGVRGERLVLGLPGNPVSAYVTFLLFARPALAALQHADPWMPRDRAPLAVAIERHPDRDECVRVRRDPDGAVRPTGPQDSHVLTSLVGAEALAVIPRGDGSLAAGAEVELEAL